MTTNRIPPKKKSKDHSYVIGIGASAGGLEAIHELFDNMPDDTGFSFVIVQHLSPDYKSLMPELLAKHSQMKIYEVEDGMPLKKDCIYLMPSRKTMKLEDGRLYLSEQQRNHLPNTAIDTFFTSLAKAKGKQAIAVILSGTGTDGSKGIEAIKEHGGIVVVQDPITAKFDGMPNSAIGTGNADLILPPEMMAAELSDYLKESPLQKAFQDMNQKDELVLRDILETVLRVTSYDFSNYKRPTIHRRLSKRMMLKGIHSMPDYLKYLRSHTDEVQQLAQEFLIGVTKFFRDEEAFDEVQSKVIPALFGSKKAKEPIKVWVVACSTGEEAYSLAILIDEYLDKNGIADPGVKIFATDIDARALAVASKGVYSDAIASDITPKRLEKYFIKEGSTYRVVPVIRKMIVFAQHDILKDPPFSRIDLVSCRNMLIYMSPELQKNVFKTFHFALCPLGFLMLGPSENIGPLKDSVKEISKKWKIFRCTGREKLLDYSFSLPADNKYAPIPSPASPRSKNALNNIAEIFKDVVIDEFKYAGIYIDKDFEVKQAIGNFKAFLNFPDGNFNLNLLKLLQPDLSVAISASVRKAIKDNEKVVMKNVILSEKGQKRRVSIVVKPFLEQSEYLQPFVFIVIQEIDTEPTKPLKELGKDIDALSAQRFMELESELNDTKQNLQAVIEELETANEELQSSNEEMISANEELQSTNEELQSLNEELHTVNAEHQLKIKELVELNDDLNNYFSNTEIGQLLIDKKMLIRKFTPAVKSQVNLRETDVGRSIIDISNNFKNLDFINDIKTVMKTGEVLSKEVTMNNGRNWQMRISPYLRLNKISDGVVVTFVDISEVKQLNSLVDGVFNSSVSAITARRAGRDAKGKIKDFTYLAVNTAAEKILGLTAKSVGTRMTAKAGPDKQYFEDYVKVVETGKPLHFEYHEDKEDKWYDVVVVKMMDGIVTTHTDITDKKASADMIARNFDELKSASKELSSAYVELEQTNFDLMQFASVISHDLKEPLRKIQTFGDRLQVKSGDKLSDEEKKYLDKMISSSFRMKTLIDDLLLYSKLSNKSAMFTSVDLNKIIHQIQDDLEIQVREKKARIDVGELPVLPAVAGQMHQFFQNLISNSLKFIHGRAPVISISQVPVDKKMAMKLGIEPEDYACICLRDNGIGFDSKYNEKIFGVFQRLTTDTSYPGTGIGLAICKRIAENHNGFVYAEGVPDKGASFFLILPKKQKKRQEAA